MLRQIELYLDGELIGVERVEIERHLGECSPCNGHSEFQRRMKEMLRAKCGCNDVPAELLERMRVLFSPPHPPAP
ncbi:MAG: zf-HC2 domain-containing protein [Actinomycetota bacterium]